MNRRGFLKGFVGVVAGAALTEKLSTTSYFLPPTGGWPGRTGEQILGDIKRTWDQLVAQAARLPVRYVDGSMIGDVHVAMGYELDALAEVPLIEYLTRPLIARKPYETDHDFRNRLLALKERWKC